MIKILLLLVCITKAFSQVEAQHYTKIFNHLDPEAKCLDGSPPILYEHQGTSKNNFLIFFYGGGFFGAEDLASTL